MEKLNDASEKASQGADASGWSDFPPFRGESASSHDSGAEAFSDEADHAKPDESAGAITEQNGPIGETSEKTPDYLSDMVPERRKEIIDKSAEMTRDIPGAIICGGNANRILYEAYTGKTMFGVGKNDSDIYVPRADFENLLTEQPESYGLKHELDDEGQEKWVRPKEDYLVLTHAGEHIDVFGSGDAHTSTEVELDGQKIQVQSLTDQINDKVRMMYETNGLADIEIDPVHNPDPVSKYGVYAQRILEMADSEKGQAELAEHADELPDDWRETLEVMAGKGEYGAEVTPDKISDFRDKLEAWRKVQELMKRMQDQLIGELKEYFELRRGNNEDMAVPALMNGFGEKIDAAFEKSSSPDEFVGQILVSLSSDEKKEIKDRIKAAAGGGEGTEN